MATLSRSPDTYSASGVRRRDARNDAGGPETTGGKKRKKKDTATWCRGKKGTPHQVERTIAGTYTGASGTTYIEYTYTSTRCGMGGRRLPDEAKAQANPDLAEQLKLAAALCAHGHAWVRGEGRWGHTKTCTRCGTTV